MGIQLDERSWEDEGVREEREREDEGSGKRDRESMRFD